MVLGQNASSSMKKQTYIAQLAAIQVLLMNKAFVSYLMKETHPIKLSWRV